MNFATLDLNLLRVFDAIMRERSVTRAGEHIGLSQPAVSAALNRLRVLLNDQLFVRRGNDLVPTPRAEDLADPIREAMARIELALLGQKTFDPSRVERTFTLFGADFFATILMPSLSDRLAAEAPGVRLRFLDSGRTDMNRLLQEGAVDIGMEPYEGRPTELISHQLLFRAPFVIVASQKMPAIKEAGLEPGSPFPIDLFCALPHALRMREGGLEGQVDSALAKQGRSRRVVLGLPQFYAVALAVSRGRVIAALPRPFADAFAARLGLLRFEPPVQTEAPEIHMYWHRRHDVDPAHKWLRGRVVATLRDEGVAIDATTPGSPAP